VNDFHGLKTGEVSNAGDTANTRGSTWPPRVTVVVVRRRRLVDARADRNTTASVLFRGGAATPASKPSCFARTVEKSAG